MKYQSKYIVDVSKVLWYSTSQNIEKPVYIPCLYAKYGKCKFLIKWMLLNLSFLSSFTKSLET